MFTGTLKYSVYLQWHIVQQKGRWPATDLAIAPGDGGWGHSTQLAGLC